MRVDLRYFILSFLVLVSFYFSNAQSTYGLDKRQVKVKTGMQDTSRSVVDITKGHIFKNKLIPDLNFSKPFPERSKDSAKNQGGLLNSLKVHGVTFGVSESLEGYYNLMGGIRVGSVVASTFDANISIDMQQLLGVSGGKFYADLEAHSFSDPSNVLVGDLQVFDKNNAKAFLQMFEFWYQQMLFNNTLRIKVGKVDANVEFSLINNGLDFMTSSAHVTPTLSVFPTFPDPMPSVNLFFTPGKLFYASAAVYDANSSNHFLDFSGKPGSIQPTLRGQLMIAETGMTWSNFPNSGKDGNLRLGFWRHNGIFNRFDSSEQHGTGGLYVVFNQTIWKPNSDKDEERGLRMFMEYAHSDSNVSSIYQHFGGGLEWTGIAASRPGDAIGVSTQYAFLSHAQGILYNYELALESFYKIHFTSWMNVAPDVQYIVHPGGKYSNALIGTLQLNLAF